MGSLRVLNSIKATEVAKVKLLTDGTRPSKGLMFVEVEVNGKASKALVDTGATHNFVDRGEANRLGLKYAREVGRMKAVNSSSLPIQGVARGVLVHLGEWKGNINLTVVDMDDYGMVLGMDFMNSVKPFYFKEDGTMEITRGNRKCSIPISREQVEATMLSSMQLKRGVQRSEATSQSPFEIVMGHQPVTPERIASGYKGTSPPAYHLAKDWQDNLDLARTHLAKAAKRMKKWADKHRRLVEFQVGDLVMIKLLPQQFKAFRKVHKGLVRKYEGPFPIIRRVGKVSYAVELPPKLKIHNVFHVSYLKAYHGDKEDPSRGESHRAPTAVVTSYDGEIEEVLADRTVRRRGVPPYQEFLIKWRGRPDTETSWEKEEDLWQFRSQLKEFKDQASRSTQDNELG